MTQSSFGSSPIISTNHQIIAWVVVILTGGYMLPWGIAATRQRPDTTKIALITFLLGWTIIGWIWMLVKAFDND